MDIGPYYESVSEDPYQAYLAEQEFLKELEKQHIRLVWAPLKMAQLEKIKTNLNNDIRTLAKETKTSLKNIVDELDKDIKGDFSKAIQTTIEEKNKLWDKI